MKFNPLPALKATAKGLLKGADAAAKVGVPIATQVDTIADAITSLKVRSKADTDKMSEAVYQLMQVKQAVLNLQPPGTIEHKRLKVAAVNAVAVVLIYAGFPAETADQVAMLVTGPAAAFILGDSYRPSGRK